MGDTKHRYEALDSLRGVAAVTVALFHFNTQGWISNAALVRNGFLFVDFFFVLSGFVIAASYGDRLRQGFPIGRFMLLRLGRLYPLHLALLAALVLLEGAQALAHKPDAFTGDHGVPMLAANLLLIQAFVGPDGLSWNSPSWSIAVEFWTYLVFALGFRLLGRWIVATALVLSVASAMHLALWSDRGLNLFHDGAFARCLYGFGLGVAAFALHRRLRGHGLSPAVASALELVVGGVAVLIVCLAGPVPLSFVLPPVFLLVVLVFARQQGIVSRLLCLRPLALVGTLSYSIYMVHQPLWYRVINLLTFLDHRTGGRFHLIEPADRHRVAGGMALGDAVSILTLGATILVAYATYRLIEKPGQLWSRRRVLGDHPVRAVLRDEREAPTF